MVRDDLVISVPSFFKCPISLDVMKSPVSLSTGVTYDRASIQKWLDSGHNTCPATMLPLPTKDFTPNRTLQRLIHSWRSNSTSHHSLLSLLHSLSTETDNNKPPSSSLLPRLTELTHLLDSDHSNSRDLLLNASCLPVLTALLRPDLDLDLAQALLRVLARVLQGHDRLHDTLRSATLPVDPAPFLLVLRKGDPAARVDAARVLDAIVSACPEFALCEREDVLAELVALAASGADPRAAEAGLTALVAAAARRRARAVIARLGAVRAVAGVLLGRGGRGGGGSTAAEWGLRLLEMVAACAEGRRAICEEEGCVRGLVGRLLKVSPAATERAVVVLWSVCHLFRDEGAQEAVAASNGLTKILLVMQSGCSPVARQMCADLVKIFRVNSKSCLSGYDTKTSHIMPF